MLGMAVEMCDLQGFFRDITIPDRFVRSLSNAIVLSTVQIVPVVGNRCKHGGIASFQLPEFHNTTARNPDPDQESFAFVHLDSDLYDSVYDSLEKATS